MTDALAELRPKQVRGVIAILKHGHVKPAAEEVGITERQFRRWMKQPAFKAALRDQAAGSMKLAIGQLQEAASQAVSVLRALLDEKQPYLRAQAAGSLLSFGFKAIEIDDLAERLDSLERALEERVAKAPAGGWQ